MIARALIRFLRRTPWSTCMALFGVSLGITSIVAVHLISTSVQQELDRLAPPTLAQFDVLLHRDDLTGADFFALYNDWVSGRAPAVLDLARRMTPVIDEQGPHQLRVIGVDLMRLDIELPGRAPGSVDGQLYGIWLDRNTAAQHGTGQLGELDDFVLNGVLDTNQPMVLGDIAVAQTLLTWQEDRLSYIGVNMLEEWRGVRLWLDRLAPGFSAGLPVLGELPMVGWRVQPFATQHPALEFGRSVLFNISALSLLALLVAWLLIYQVAVSWLRRLSGTFSRLVVLGVYDGVLRRYFLFLMVGFALLAVACGLPLGLFLAEWLRSVALPEVPFAGYEVDRWVTGKALVSALGVCVIGGYWAFRGFQRPPRSGFKWQASAVLLLLLAGLGVQMNERSGLAGGFFSIACICVAFMLMLPILMKTARRMARMVGGGYWWRLTVREVVWHPRDLAVALSGLCLAIATGMGVGIMVDSFRVDFNNMLAQRLVYDYQITGEAQALERLWPKLQQHPSVRARTYRALEVRINDVPVEVVATELDRTEAARYGFKGKPGGGELLASERALRALNLQEGHVVDMLGKAFTVAGRFQGFGESTGKLVVDARSIEGDGTVALQSISVDMQHAENSAALVNALMSAVPELRWVHQNDIRVQALRTFEDTFAITSVLVVIAIIVAAIGIYIALTVLRLNQSFNDRILAGLGITAWERLRIDLYRGVGLGLVAGAFALPVGLYIGWCLCTVINPRAFGWSLNYQLTWATLFTPWAWGMVGAVLAAVVRIGRSEEGRMDATF